jgi:hypothetical protein
MTGFKIALYGFGSQPAVHRYLIELASNENLPLSWCAILTTPHYRSLIAEVLPPREVLDIYRDLPRIPARCDLDDLAYYHGSILEDLAAQKRMHRRRSGRWLLGRGLDYYRLYKRFLAERGATHILMGGVETPDAKIAIATAQEFGVGVITPVDLRNMTGTYFSIDSYETPPSYAAATPEAIALAAEFVQRFRVDPAPASGVPAELAAEGGDEAFPAHIPSLPGRIRGFIANALERPDIFDHEEVRISVMGNAALLRNTVRGMRYWRNIGQYDIDDTGELPSRFAFYPLQYSPESSINTPAPYFVDQMRAIDAIRFAIPSDHWLVVKEHPACVEMRPPSFMRRLRRTPGVIVMKSTVSSIELIKRAGITITVSGTAALEAFLLGRPSLALGRGLSAWLIGKNATDTDLRSRIVQSIQNPPSDRYIVEQVARLMSARYPFLFTSPNLPGEPMLRLNNLRRFVSALYDHLQREHPHHKITPTHAAIAPPRGTQPAVTH